MSEVIYCGPRGLHKDGDIWKTQIVKHIRSEDGPGRHYVLRQDGEWHEYGKNYVFTADDEFTLGGLQ